MLLGFQEGALEAPQAGLGLGDALFQHDVITQRRRRPVLAGPASLVLARPLGEPLSLRRPGSLPWDINQSLDGQLLPHTTTRLLTLALGGSLFNALLTGS